MPIFINTDHPVTNKAAETWGMSGQTDILQEEAGEIVTAISRFRRGRTGPGKVAEEIADVMVCCMSVIPALGIEDLVKQYMEAKINRLQRRIDSGNNCD